MRPTGGGTGFGRAAKAANGRMILAQSPLPCQAAFAESHESGKVTTAMLALENDLVTEWLLGITHVDNTTELSTAGLTSAPSKCNRSVIIAG
jgi:hypothetical protein